MPSTATAVPELPGEMRFQQVEPLFIFAGHAGAIPVNLPNTGTYKTLPAWPRPAGM